MFELTEQEKIARKFYNLYGYHSGIDVNAMIKKYLYEHGLLKDLTPLLKDRKRLLIKS